MISFDQYLYSVFGFQGTVYSSCPDGWSFLEPSGDGEIRTLDPLLARQVLSQLSYTPTGPISAWIKKVGLSGLEPPTSRLSGVRSNRLSYKPALIFLFWIRQPPVLPYRCRYSTFGRPGLNRRVRDGNGCFPRAHRHRKCFVVSVCVSALALTTRQ